MTRRGDTGFALLLVLWSLVLLSLILTQLLSAGRSEAQLAGNLRQAAMAEAVADGAVQAALFHLAAAGPEAWAHHGVHVVPIGRGVAEVMVDDLSSKLNPNTAGLQVLRALVGLCGASPAQAVQLARAIMDWRGDPPDGDPDAAYRSAGLAYLPPGLPMQTVDELGLVAGMTKPLLGCLAPHVSLLQEGEPGLHGADSFVARAVAAAALGEGAAAEATGVSDAVQVTAVATVEGGRFVRRVTARLGLADGGRAFRILSWGTSP